MIFIDITYFFHCTLVLADTLTTSILHWERITPTLLLLNAGIPKKCLKLYMNVGELQWIFLGEKFNNVVIKQFAIFNEAKGAFKVRLLSNNK